MCSINGFIRFGDKTSPEAIEKMRSIIQKGEQRGKDSFGYTVFHDDKSVETFRFIDKPTNILPDEFNVKPETFLLLNNNRAEPTTEYILEKNINDVQPYKGKNCHVVHNGTIANDKELVEKFNLPVETSIDSAVIPFMFDDVTTTERAIEVLRDELIGSYAVAIYNEKTDVLYLATNYKPLSIAFDRRQDILYFTSLENFVRSDDYNEVFGDRTFKEVKPYTLLVIDRKSREIKSHSLYKEKPKGTKKKALILASSGLDSTVAIAWSIEQGYDTTLLHFNYHCRAEHKESEHIEKISKYYDIPVVKIDVNFFRDVIKGSRLTDVDAEICHDDEKGAELAIEWVPARNLIFFSIATGYAESHDIDYIILGGNLEESGAYSDNELIFQKKFNDLLPHSLNLQKKVEILTPVADLMKKDIVELGLKLKAPLHLTWSCYEPGEYHCGTCGPCFMRKTAFKILNEPEVIKYENDGQK